MACATPVYVRLLIFARSSLGPSLFWPLGVWFDQRCRDRDGLKWVSECRFPWLSRYSVPSGFVCHIGCMILVGMRGGGILEPEACLFTIGVAKVVRLDDLVRLSIKSTHDANGILDDDLRDVGVDHSHEEVDTFLLSTVFTLLCEPCGAADREVGAWRECDHHIPSVVEVFEDVVMDVPLRIPFAWDDVAGPRIVAEFP